MDIELICDWIVYVLNSCLNVERYVMKVKQDTIAIDWHIDIVSGAVKFHIAFDPHVCEHAQYLQKHDTLTVWSKLVS